MKRKEQQEPIPEKVKIPSIPIGIVVDGQVVEVFYVSTPRLAALFLSNPTY